MRSQADAFAIGSATALIAKAMSENNSTDDQAKKKSDNKSQASSSSNPNERATLENEYTKKVVALFRDFGKGLDDECNPITRLGDKHDSDDNKVAQILEFFHVRTKRALLARTSTNYPFSKFTQSIASFLNAYHEADVVGTKEICESRDLLLQFIRDIYINIMDRFDKRPREQVEQLDILKNIITAVLETSNDWHMDLKARNFSDYFSKNGKAIEEFSLLLPTLQEEINQTIEPIKLSINRTLLPTGFNSLLYHQKNVIAPQLEQLILYSVTHEELDQTMLTDKATRQQLSEPETTHESFKKTKVGKNRIANPLTNSANLFALARHLIAPKPQQILDEIENEVHKDTLLQQVASQKIAATETASYSQPLLTSHFQIGTSATQVQQIPPQYLPSNRVTKLIEQYVQSIAQLYSKEVIDSFLPKTIFDILYDVHTDSAASINKSIVVKYRETFKELLIIYHKQVQLMSLNKRGGALAVHMNTLLPLIMPEKISEVSNFNFIFYAKLDDALRQHQMASINLRSNIYNRQSDKGWGVNANKVYTLVERLRKTIETATYNHIHEINSALTKKNIQDNTQDLLINLAQFNVLLQLTKLSPQASPAENSLTQLLFQVTNITASMPEHLSDTFLLEEGLSGHPHTITQAQLQQPLATPSLLINLLVKDNYLESSGDSHYLVFRQGPRFPLDNETTAQWIERYKAKARKSLTDSQPLLTRSQTSSPSTSPNMRPLLLPASDLHEAGPLIEILSAEDEYKALETKNKNDCDAVAKAIEDNLALDTQYKIDVGRQNQLNRQLGDHLRVPAKWWISIIGLITHGVLRAGVGLYQLLTYTRTIEIKATYAALEENKKANRGAKEANLTLIETLNHNIETDKVRLAELKRLVEIQALRDREVLRSRSNSVSTPTTASTMPSTPNFSHTPQIIFSSTRRVSAEKIEFYSDFILERATSEMSKIASHLLPVSGRLELTQGLIVILEKILKKHSTFSSLTNDERVEIYRNVFTSLTQAKKDEKPANTYRK